MMDYLWPALFFVGLAGVYMLVTRHFMRELRLGVKEWSRKKRVMFALRMNRTLFFSYSWSGRIWDSPKNKNIERKWIKDRIATPGEDVGDKEADLFLELNARRKRWVIGFGLLYVVLFGFAMIITQAIKDGQY
jgi:hypothetical protein